MNSSTIRQVTGTAGLIGALLTRSMFGLTGLTLFVVFPSGIRYLVRDRAPSYEWVGGLATAAGLM
ncbi:hypothetical protein [Nocardia sp. NPDC057227]|uniref:hypothetical protein n=1 Tax=Nocardia sp. NPDC057227 TaxID=3346056 RepID=UPI0036294BBC